MAAQEKGRFGKLLTPIRGGVLPSGETYYGYLFGNKKGDAFSIYAVPNGTDRSEEWVRSYRFELETLVHDKNEHNTILGVEDHIFRRTIKTVDGRVAGFIGKYASGLLSFHMLSPPEFHRAYCVLTDTEYVPSPFEFEEMNISMGRLTLKAKGYHADGTVLLRYLYEDAEDAVKLYATTTGHGEDVLARMELATRVCEQFRVVDGTQVIRGNAQTIELDGQKVSLVYDSQPFAISLSPLSAGAGSIALDHFKWKLPKELP
jgi:hypothetical protein